MLKFTLTILFAAITFVGADILFTGLGVRIPFVGGVFYTSLYEYIPAQFAVTTVLGQVAFSSATLYAATLMLFSAFGTHIIVRTAVALATIVATVLFVALNYMPEMTGEYVSISNAVQESNILFGSIFGMVMGSVVAALVTWWFESKETVTSLRIKPAVGDVPVINESVKIDAVDSSNDKKADTAENIENRIVINENTDDKASK